MEWLSSRDFHNLLKAIDRLDAECDLVGFRERAIAAIRRGSSVVR